jgi:hypothetical protein
MPYKEVVEKALGATLVDESLLDSIKGELDKLNKSRATQSVAFTGLRLALGVRLPILR